MHYSHLDDQISSTTDSTDIPLCSSDLCDCAALNSLFSLIKEKTTLTFQCDLYLWNQATNHIQSHHMNISIAFLFLLKVLEMVWVSQEKLRAATEFAIIDKRWLGIELWIRICRYLCLWHSDRFPPLFLCRFYSFDYFLGDIKQGKIGYLVFGREKARINNIEGFHCLEQGEVFKTGFFP